jgi:AcrR family transcriptional regulator
MSRRKRQKAPEARPERLPLTRDRVLQAAVQLADQGGLDAVSMRSLAQSLGVEAMSLYNHVANKDEVLGGMVERVLEEISLPVEAFDWKGAMRQRAFSAREMLRRHPWACSLLVSRMNTGPAMLRYIDATLGCLRAAGFSYELADHARNALDSFLYGFTLQELSFPVRPSDYAETAKQYVSLLPPEQYPHMHALTQLVIRGSYRGVHDFSFGLELLLEGLERHKTRSP